MICCNEDAALSARSPDSSASDFLLAELLKDVRPSCGVVPRSAVRRQHEHAVSSVDSRQKTVLR